MASGTEYPSYQYRNGVNGHYSDPQKGRKPYSGQTPDFAASVDKSIDALGSLQGEEERRVFDIIDRLRSLDVNRELKLPQLVVCGGQSSGKSSVLEAISRLSFPRGEGICTRFVTEIQFRRGDEREVKVMIVPDPHRSASEQREIAQMQLQSFDPNQLGKLVTEAGSKLGIDQIYFSQDVLRVQITGQQYPPLTLVDLPGLINYSDKGEKFLKFVDDLVDSWIEQDRSIILAVIDAKNDKEKHSILGKAKRFDPTGQRTFGIITQPDRAVPNSKNEQFYIELACNDPSAKADYNFKKGWHVLKNRGDDQHGISPEKRDENETAFFRDVKNKWSTVSPHYWGIETLRGRLSTLLYEHTRAQIPFLQNDIRQKLRAYETELKGIETQLHAPEKTWQLWEEEKHRLSNFVYQQISGNVTNGASASEERGPLDLRPALEEAYEEFVKEFKAVDASNGLPGAEPSPILIPEMLTEKAKQVLIAFRGQELEGHDPKLMSKLFWNRSKGWYALAEAHVEVVYNLCQQFILNVINGHLKGKLPTTIPDSIGLRMIEYLETALMERKVLALEGLKALDGDRNRLPKTKNPAYMNNSAKKKQEETMAQMMRARGILEAENVSNENPRPLHVTPASMHQALGNKDGLDSGAMGMAIEMLVYYQVARDTFIDNVIVQVVERHLIWEFEMLFNGDFNMDQATFFELLQSVDTTALKTRKKDLEDRIAKLKACQSELPAQ